ncbi:MAG: 1-aminocyclopropane-1-carboxylate deaminase/D-cysteine desulfhydrase [Bacteroidota bacterium]|jgi:1-aminocyclopropane-1-carboxylate deaminase
MNFDHPDIRRSILQEIHIKLLNKDGNRLFVKRDDLIHNIISGNKWRKIQLSLLKAKSEGKEGILTFGGAHSNHLIATAAAAQLNEVRSIGIVRGDELNRESNETLQNCATAGMELVFTSRVDYANRNERWYQEKLALAYPNFYIIPEGGANYLGMIGCQQILGEVTERYDVVVVAQGTSTTAVGLLLSLPNASQLWGVPVLKGYQGATEIKALLTNSGFASDSTGEFLERYLELGNYHFGGYASYTNELLDLIEYFWTEFQLPLDPVYTAKAMFALLTEVKNKRISNTNFLFIHTGGLQGSKPIFMKEKRDIF